MMTYISRQQYEQALNRIEELLSLVADETPKNDKCLVELIVVSDIIEVYEKEHYSITNNNI